MENGEGGTLVLGIGGGVWEWLVAERVVTTLYTGGFGWGGGYEERRHRYMLQWRASGGTLAQ